jgi:predicted DNA-binding WGR domain protein
MVTLRNIDPANNRWRFYSVAIGRTLFGDLSITREWGRIGSPGRIAVESFASEEEARRGEQADHPPARPSRLRQVPA